MELVRRVLVVGQIDDGVLEGEQYAGIDCEREVQVDRPAATFLWVEVDLPHLTQRVRLDEVALVMNMEPVVHRVILQLGHVAGHVDHCHPVTPPIAASPPA